MPPSGAGSPYAYSMLMYPLPVVTVPITARISGPHVMPGYLNQPGPAYAAGAVSVVVMTPNARTRTTREIRCFTPNLTLAFIETEYRLRAGFQKPHSL